MHTQVLHNGHVQPLTDVRLSPGQAGLLNGWGVFSTVRIYEGHPFAFEFHWERLSKDAALLMVPLPITREQCYDGVMELIKANHVHDGCMRIYFVLNKVGIWCSDEPMPQTDWIMYTVDLPMRRGAVKLALQENGRQAMHPLAGTKVISWLQNVWVVEKAHQRGFEDAILVNEFGNVTEATAANLYIVKNEKVVTAPLSSGCLAGVSRLLLKKIAAEHGIDLSERNYTPEELFAADEIFITSTTRQVQPVGQIESHTFSSGPMTAKLSDLFDGYVKQHHEDALRAREAVKG